MEQNDTSRRDLLQWGVVAGAACLLTGCKSAGTQKAEAADPPQNRTITLTPEQSAKLLAAEGALLLKPKGLGDRILVVRAKDGSLHATSSVCTHAGCDVEYDQGLGHIRCPCHGSQFGIDGHNVKGPARRPLKEYRVSNDQGRVIINL